MISATCHESKCKKIQKEVRAQLLIFATVNYLLGFGTFFLLFYSEPHPSSDLFKNGAIHPVLLVKSK